MPSSKVKCKLKNFLCVFPETSTHPQDQEVYRTQFTQTEISKKLREIPYYAQYFYDTHKAGSLVTRRQTFKLFIASES